MHALLQQLPLAQHRKQIEQHLEQHRHLLLQAPTGTGKSSWLPFFLQQQAPSSRVLVLQPRRMAAIGLAQFLTECIEEPIGHTVGYSIRFESRCHAQTRILFQTYGAFQQSLRHHPVPDWDWILLDEFHERRVDMDLTLAALLAPQFKGRLAVVSAGMDHCFFSQKLNAPVLSINSKNYPIQILHQSSSPGTDLPQQVCKALRILEFNLKEEERTGTTLVFLPGLRDMQFCQEKALEMWSNQSDHAPQLCLLHGSQSLEEQKAVLQPPHSWRIVFCTNIAETSLTLPDVHSVIDSGWERRLEFHSTLQIQQLRTVRITQQNALQRQGRAGRTRAGFCIKLWPENEKFNAQIQPEILRVPLESPLLQFTALRKTFTLQWLTNPPQEALQKSRDELERLQIIDSKNQQLTLQGQEILTIPCQDPLLAHFLLKAPRHELSAALATLLELSPTQQHSGMLLDLGQNLLDNLSRSSLDVRRQFQRLQHWQQKHPSKISSHCKNQDMIQALLETYPQQLAILAPSGQAYQNRTGAIVQLSPQQTQNALAILLFRLTQTGQNQHQKSIQCWFCPVPENLLQQQNLKDHWSLVWKPKPQRYQFLRTQSNHQQEINRQEIPWDQIPSQIQISLQEDVAKQWWQRHQKEDLSHLWMDESNQTLWHKMLWAHQIYPEHHFPAWNTEDWELILHEFFHGCFAQKDLTPQRFRPLLEEYFGAPWLSWLHKNFPEALLLPSGRKARYTYPHPTQRPVELSARIGDFLGFHGLTYLSEGRLQVRYNILAPNYRTAQKTWNMDDFWKQTYPQLRKELRGRYPKHPWPETGLKDSKN